MIRLPHNVAQDRKSKVKMSLERDDLVTFPTFSPCSKQTLLTKLTLLKIIFGTRYCNNICIELRPDTIGKCMLSSKTKLKLELGQINSFPIVRNK